MNPYSIVIDRFLKKIKKDRKFFSFREKLNKEDIIAIVNQRSLDILINSLDELVPKIAYNQNVDFNNRDDDLELFNFELVKIEIDLISDLMVVKYFEEEEIKLKNLQSYIGDDIKVFCPADERNSFISMMKYKRSLFEKKLDDYNSRDRLTNKPLMAY